MQIINELMNLMDEENPIRSQELNELYDREDVYLKQIYRQLGKNPAEEFFHIISDIKWMEKQEYFLMGVRLILTLLRG